MDLDRIDSVVRQSYRKNGRELQQHTGRTPLSELIAKDQLPDLQGMTEMQLCEYAAEHHVAIDEGLERWEMIESIKEARDKNWDERLAGMRATLDYVFGKNPHPLEAVRRLYAIAKSVRPHLVRGMSLAQLAVLCGDGNGNSTDGRATQSARAKRLVEKPIRQAGMHGSKSNFQKSQGAVEAYSRAQKGNQNRHGSGYLKISKEKAKAS